MNEVFRRQLAAYAGYHRDPRNCLTHAVGIPVLFLAVLIPLALRRVPLGAFEVALGSLLLIPAVAAWIALDFRIGAAMLAAIVPLAIAAEWIARSAGVTRAVLVAATLFVIGWALQIVGHAVFERRKPALLDNAFHMFIGPMFITAKILVALGVRPDLLALVQARGPTNAVAGELGTVR